MKTMKTLAVMALLVAVTGCANSKIDALAERVTLVEAGVAEAQATAGKAQSSADAAQAAADKAQAAANDAVEAVSRMAEKCCRK